MTVNQIRGACAIAAALSCVPTTGVASDVYWVGYQNGCMVSHPDVGSFFHGDNWFGFAVPGTGDVARFGTGYDPQGNGVRPHVIHFGDFCLNVSNCPNPIPLPGGAAANAGLVMQSDVWTFDFDPGSVGGCNPPGNKPGAYAVNGNIVIGDFVQETGQPGTASLSLRGAGMFATDGAVIGAVTGSRGSVSIEDGDTTWSVRQSLVVGGFGVGTLRVANAAHLSTGAGSLGSSDGQNAYGDGTVTVTGAGSTWDGAEWLDIGSGGTGELVVENGGRVTNAFTRMSVFRERATGTAVVRGQGSRWDLDSFLDLGNSGDATLTIAAGGRVTVPTSAIGLASTSTCAAVVRGQGSSFNLSGGLEVGRFGVGTLLVEDGATVSSGAGNLGGSDGQNAHGNGTVTVSGTGSTWNVEQWLDIGSGGTGELIVENGGQVASAFTRMAGFREQALASAVVSGAGSNWTPASFLDVGNAGNATLLIERGGSVSTSVAAIGLGSASNSSATVRGESSSLTVDGSLVVGSLGAGELTIIGGAAVSSGSGFLGGSDGQNTFGDGTVVVSEAPSRWAIDGPLDVGGGGTGHLTIQSGAHVSNSFARLGGFQPNASGIVVVSDPGSRWTSSSFVNVGDFGSGEVSVVNEGVVAAASMRVSSTGVLRGNGVVQSVVTNAGEVRPGPATDTLRIEGDYHQGADGTLFIELGGTNPGGSHDRLVVDGDVTLDGVLDIALVNGFAPSLGDQFDIVGSNLPGGAFSRVDGGNLGGGLVLQPVYLSDGVSLVAGTEVRCQDIRKFKADCVDRKLTVKVKSSLAQNTPMIIDNAGELAVMTVKGNGKGKAKFKKQSGEHRVLIVDCPEFERVVDCGK